MGSRGLRKTEGASSGGDRGGGGERGVGSRAQEKHESALSSLVRKTLTVLRRSAPAGRGRSGSTSGGSVVRGGGGDSVGNQSRSVSLGGRGGSGSTIGVGGGAGSSSSNSGHHYHHHHHHVHHHHHHHHHRETFAFPEPEAGPSHGYRASSTTVDEFPRAPQTTMTESLRRSESSRAAGVGSRYLVRSGAGGNGNGGSGGNGAARTSSFENAFGASSTVHESFRLNNWAGGGNNGLSVGGGTGGGGRGGGSGSGSSSTGGAGSLSADAVAGGSGSTPSYLLGGGQVGGLASPPTRTASPGVVGMGMGMGPPMGAAPSRRQSRRGPLRRMLFRRQRWMFAEHDWNIYDFERSYLYPQHIRLLEYIDDLSHEEMLALEEHMGVVSCGLNEEDLAKIPIESVEGYRDALAGTGAGKGVKDEERTCTICLDDFIKGDLARKLPCDHQFHVNCVDPWLQKNKLCPVCKAEVQQQAQSQPPTPSSTSHVPAPPSSEDDEHEEDDDDEDGDGESDEEETAIRETSSEKDRDGRYAISNDDDLCEEVARMTTTTTTTTTTSS